MLPAFRRHPVLSTAFALAVVLALWLLVEVATSLFGWHGRGPEPLAPWMTVGYVGRVNDLDPRLIDAIVGFPTPEEAGHPLTLQEIADRRGVPVEEVYRELDRALRELHGHGHDGRWDGRAGMAGEEAEASTNAPPPSNTQGPAATGAENAP